LGSADFQLPNSQLVGITRRSLLWCEWSGKLFEPTVEKSLDIVGIQLVTNSLQTIRGCVRQKTIPQGFKTNAFLAQLLFGCKV